VAAPLGNTDELITTAPVFTAVTLELREDNVVSVANPVIAGVGVNVVN